MNFRLIAPCAFSTLALITTAAIGANVGDAAKNADRKDLARCAAVVGELKRLECYDQLSRSLGLIAHAEKKVMRGTGAWEVSTETNPIDDTKTVTASLRAKDGQSRWGQPVVLHLRCMSGKTEAIISWNEYLGSDSTNVLVRIGSESAEEQSWLLSTDHQATFLRGDTLEFIKKLRQASKLVAQVTPYGENPRTAIFELAGTANATASLSKECKWPDIAEVAPSTDTVRAQSELAPPGK